MDVEESVEVISRELSRQLIPWENPSSGGLIGRFFKTIWAFVTAPSASFSKMPTSGGLSKPLSFAILVAWIGIAVAGLVGEMNPDADWNPDDPEENFTMTGFAGSKKYFGVGLIVAAPVITFVVVFAQAKIIQFLLGLFHIQSRGYQSTFRICCYSQTSQLLHPIPFIGAYASIAWTMLLLYHGIAVVHGVSRGRSLAVVLTATITCCGIAFVSFVALALSMLDFAYPR